jgi:hypothetical protein
MKLFGIRIPGTHENEKAAPTPAPPPPFSGERPLGPKPTPIQPPPPKLTIELVPQTCWISNVRSHVTAAQWNTIRRATCKRSDLRCEVCGGRGTQHPVECHEVFEFDDRTRVQTLVQLVALCPACHRVKHFGLAQGQGHGAQAFAHLCRVNGWRAEQAERYVEEQFALWKARSRHPWTVDLGLLESEFGITVQEEGAQAGTERAETFRRQKFDEYHKGSPRGCDPN